MAEREKVIRSLEWCIKKPCHPNCPYFTAEDEIQARCLFTKILPDALALLKEQEPRVMALDEVVNADGFVWAEIWTPRNKKWSLIYARIRKCIDDELLNLQEDSGMEWTRLVCDYNMNGLLDCGWRCWTSRPTPEQMRDTKWEE